MNKTIQEEYNKYQEPFLLGRVTTVHKTHYLVTHNKIQFTCQVSGRFKYLNNLKSDYPVVGDYVIFLPSEYEESGIIEKVCTRYSSLDRLGVDGTGQKQILASNSDIVFVCMSLNQDFNVKKLRRLLSLSYSSHAETIILLTKSDLTDHIESYMDQVRQIDSTSVIYPLSINNPETIHHLSNLLQDKTGVFLGSSGVGKSTLINTLLHKEHLQTKTIRESDAQGRHTTSHRELIALPNNGFVIDTPGIRIIHSYIVEDMDSAYNKVMNLAQKCKFHNCTHTSEPNCNVKENLETGHLTQEEYDSYIHTIKLNKHNKRKELYRSKLQNKRIKG